MTNPGDPSSLEAEVKELQKQSLELVRHNGDLWQQIARLNQRNGELVAAIMDIMLECKIGSDAHARIAQLFTRDPLEPPGS